MRSGQNRRATFVHGASRPYGNRRRIIYGGNINADDLCRHATLAVIDGNRESVSAVVICCRCIGKVTRRGRVESHRAMRGLVTDQNAKAQRIAIRIGGNDPVYIRLIFLGKDRSLINTGKGVDPCRIS